MIYRIEYFSKNCESHGFSIFGNKADAEKEWAKWCLKEGMPIDEHNNPDIGVRYKTITSHITPTNKKEMIALLERWGCHPNNG